MANDTTVSDSFRNAALSNLDSLGERRRMLEAELARLEQEFRDNLAAALAPIEDQLRDTNAAIYATERTLGALPPASPRFSERANGDSADDRKAKGGTPTTEEVDGSGIAEG